MRFALSLVFVLLAARAQGQGSGWRGDGTGQYPRANPPLTWDVAADKNILWRAKVGASQSTPVFAGDRILLTAEPDRLLAVDRRSGKILWSVENSYAALPSSVKRPEKKPPTAEGCGYSTPTPVCDGRCVFVVFGTGIVASYDLDGNRKWIRCLDLTQVTEYGRSASPVLAGGKLLVSLSGLTALDPQTGEVLWDAPKARSAYGTPAVARIGDVDVILTPQGDCVCVADGRILARKLGSANYASPLVSAGAVYFVGTRTVALRLPEKAGDSLQFQKLWDTDEIEGQVFASPVCHEGLLYCVSNDGVLYVLDVQNGNVVYRKELEIQSASGRIGAPVGVYPSITLTGKHLLVGNASGEMLVLTPGREYQEIAHNRLDKGAGSSPVADGSLLLLRGGTSLFGLRAIK
jgi:outer membrane protein assembly factor BamB